MLEILLEPFLYNRIVPEESSYKDESVGTVVISLKKKEQKLWRYLLDQKESKNSTTMKPKIWWSLSSLYPEEMKRFE